MIDPQQVLFHPLKHHLHAIVDFIKTGSEQSFANNLKQVKTMGASQFDLYTGKLAVANIAAETATQLHEAGIATEQQYQDWLTANGGYRAILLSDGSEWTLRHVTKEAFVHIHPARYALHTLRIKANAMKTVCCYLLLQGWNDEAPDIIVLNQTRTQYLDLSPVAVRNGNDELMKVYMLLRNGLIKNNH